MTTILLLIGAFLPVVSSATYMWAIATGEVRPQVTTRFLLMAITILSLASLLAAHDHTGVWLALTSAIQSVVLWVFALWKGTGSLFNRLDMTCLGLCAIGVIFWIVSGQSLTGLLASMAADVFGCAPSIYKTWRQPYTETITFYALDAVAGLCILFSTAITWLNALFPIYIFLINAVFVVVIVLRRQGASEQL